MIHDLVATSGLILPAGLRAAAVESRALTRDVEKGVLVKIRRGAFIESDLWHSSTPRQRHVFRIRAALAVQRRQVIVAGLSAAALWGMPIAGDWPSEVTLLDEWRGGGHSEHGVRRTASGFLTARRVDLDGIDVTSLARTAIDVARSATFSGGVGSLDWALWRKNPRALRGNELVEELERYDFRKGRRQAEAQIAFSTSLSDSFGESECRSVIHLLGFDPPDLQIEIRDSQGLMIPDFAWLGVQQLGEFDGKLKYTRCFAPGDDIGEVVWQEKKREDRLRRKGFGMTRMLTSDVKTPARLEALLVEARVPRPDSP